MGIKNLFIILIFNIFLMYGTAIANSSSGQDLKFVLKQIELLKKEIKNKNQEIESLRAEIEALKKALYKKPKTVASREVKEISPAPETVSAPKIVPALKRIGLGGQYRINSYSVHTHHKNINASRLRIRQNVDLTFSENFNTHLQIELGHTPANLTTTRNRIRVRHAMVTYKSSGYRLSAGIIPISDNFNDVLYSADWDYNPLSFLIEKDFGPYGRIRFFGAQLDEGEEDLAHDDFSHYELSWSLKPIPALRLSSMFLYADVAGHYADPAGGNSDHTYAHLNYGIKLDYTYTKDFILSTTLLGSFTDKNIIGTDDDASGIFVKFEASKKLNHGSVSFLVTHASGDSEGEGFMPLMALTGTYGYWGYTGILTVQGPTDTGFDDNAVNVSNNGYGLTTVQGRLFYDLTDKLGINVAAGWFGNTKARHRSSIVGYDALGMLTYRFNNYLKLDLGIAFAHIKDSVNGYATRAFNLSEGKSEDKIAGFSRFQAEF